MPKHTAPSVVASSRDESDYAANVSVTIPDAPAWSPDLARYGRYKPFPGEGWEAFKARIDMSFAGAEAACDVERPIWEADKFEAPVAHGGATPSGDQIERAFAQARGHGPCGEALLAKLIPFLPVAKLAPLPGGDPATADFRWSKMRCLFAQAGFQAHAGFTAALAGLGCPWSADETEEEWKTAVEEAHRNCGWPTTMVQVRWGSMRGIPATPDHALLPSWILAKAWLHVLGHVKREPNGLFLRVVYHGQVSRLRLSDVSNILGHQTAVLPALLMALGCVTKKTKDTENPFTRAVRAVLMALEVNKLEVLRPLSRLPPTVLAGRWTTIKSTPEDESWEDLGVTLDGAWEVADAKVVASNQTDGDVTFGFDWNVIDPTSEANTKARAKFESILPDVAPALYPADLACALFPNLVVPDGVDMHAYKALMEHGLFASLLRAEGGIDNLTREFPLFCVLPDKATADESTEQGKTAFAALWARAQVPDCKTVKAMDSSSAPDTRAVAEEVRQWGTVCLDEWIPPVSKSSILSRDNLQSLCTGGSLLVGRVMENVTGEISLTHSICLSSKALDFAPDLINRSSFWFLRILTDEEKRSPLFPDIASGKMSLLMRLGALSLVERLGLHAKLAATPYDGSKGYRFGAHYALAQMLYEARCAEFGVPVVPDAIPQAIKAMRTKHDLHCRDADDGGLLVSLVEGKDIKLRLSGLFTDLSGRDLESMLGWLRAKYPSVAKVPVLKFTPSALIRARLALRGMGEAPLASALPEWIGRKLSMSDRAVGMSFCSQIRRELPAGSGWRLPGVLGLEGWHVIRYKDHKGGMFLSLRKVAGTEAITIAADADESGLDGES